MPFGSLAMVAMYLCGLALFAQQGPAVASALLAFFNQMVFVQSRIAMLEISTLAFGLFAIAAFMFGFRKRRPHVWFAPVVATAFAGLGCVTFADGNDMRLRLSGCIRMNR